MKISTTIVSTAGRPSGSTTRHSVCQLEAPSSRAASTSERGTERKNARIQNVPNADRDADLRQDQRPVGVGQAEVAQVVVERDDERLQRHHQAEQQHVEEHRRAAEAHHPERVAGHDREARVEIATTATTTIALDRR